MYFYPVGPEILDCNTLFGSPCIKESLIRIRDSRVYVKIGRATRYVYGAFIVHQTAVVKPSLSSSSSSESWRQCGPFVRAIIGRKAQIRVYERSSRLADGRQRSQYRCKHRVYALMTTGRRRGSEGNRRGVSSSSDLTCRLPRRRKGVSAPCL